MTGRRNVGRIDHFVWVVREENLERYVEEASELFGAEFEHMHGPTLAGTDRNCYVSWDAGLEFIAPLGAADATSAMFLEYLERHGEGPWGFVFGVRDLNAPTDNARNRGYAVGELVQQADEAVRHEMMARWTNRVDDAREVYIGTFLGTEVMFGDIRYAADRVGRGDGTDDLGV